MVYLKHSEISLIENFVAWPRGRGYVLRFLDNTFAEFFKDEFQIEIYDSSYQDQRETSKRHHLISFCLQEPTGIVARVLSMLADKRRQLADASPSPPQDGLQDPFEALVAAIETRADQPLTDALYLYAQDRSLGETSRTTANTGSRCAVPPWRSSRRRGRSAPDTFGAQNPAIFHAH